MKLKTTSELRAKWKLINIKRVKDGKPKLNFSLLMRVRNRIDAIPESYDQSTFAETSDLSPCGTVACLAGETIICASKNIEEGIQKLLQIDTLRNTDKVAGELLGFTGGWGTIRGERDIFDGDAESWPLKFRIQFNKGRQAKAAVGLLTRIIRTGKVLE